MNKSRPISGPHLKENLAGFQEYKKHLNDKDADYEDTAVALQLVLQAASHANEMMKKLVGFRLLFVWSLF